MAQALVKTAAKKAISKVSGLVNAQATKRGLSDNAMYKMGMAAAQSKAKDMIGSGHCGQSGSDNDIVMYPSGY